MAQVDYFLKIEGIQGESTDSKHKNEIDVLSWKWDELNAATHGLGGGGGAGKVKMNDFHFAMTTSKASPVLMLSCASGKHIKKAELFCRKAGGDQQEYMKITLGDVMVTSYKVSGHAGAGDNGAANGASNGASNGVPFDEVSLGYTQIEVEYKPQKADGSLDSPVKAGWNRATNVKV